MAISKVALLANPLSGRGRSSAAAKAVCRILQAEGLAAEVKESPGSLQPNVLHDFVAGADLLVVAGGDGTLMHLLAVLEQTGTPVYMLPTGNESLFARQFRMTVDPKRLLGAIRRGRISEHYVGEINDHPFFTMVSVGLDSHVIKRMSECRKGTVRRLSYLLPTLGAAIRHTPPLLTLKVDGTLELENMKGFLIIANSNQYALGIRFVPEASSASPTLSARFFPYSSSLGYFNWCMKCMVRNVQRSNCALHFTGNTFELEVANDDAYPVQADGENIGTAPCRVVIADKKIRVLDP